MSVFQLHGAGTDDRRGAPELVDARPRAVVGNRAEEVGERFGVEREVHEDERAPGVDPHGNQAGVVGRSDAELAARRHLAQRAREVVRPTVERATDLGEAEAGSLAECAAAVPARVLERAQLEIVAAHHEHRDGPDAELVEVARVRDVIE